MLSGKDFVSRNLFGERFDKNIYRNGFDLLHAKKGLTPSGKDIIEKFILQNKYKSNMMKKREEELYKAFHSKLPKRHSIDYRHIDSFNLNKNKGEEFKIKNRPIWKWGYQSKNEFGPLLVDKEYIFDLPKNIKYSLNQPPFKRPKEYGDFFDKDIHILGGNLEKY